MQTKSKIGRIVFIRHGESVWNITDTSRGLTSRFTGWADIDLTKRGLEQAEAAGRCLKTFGIKPNTVYTSLLRRSQDTFAEMLKGNPMGLGGACIINSWRLNERHYGALVGLSKDEAGYKFLPEYVVEWRRSWDKAPPPLSPRDLVAWKKQPSAQPVTIVSTPEKTRYIIEEKSALIPTTESISDCAARVKPLWKSYIAPQVAKGETVLIVAHANSIRSMLKHIDDETMSLESFRAVNIPSATPLIYDFLATETSEHGRIVSRSLKPLGHPTTLGLRGRYVVNRSIVELNLKSTPAAKYANEDDLRMHGSTSTFFDLVDQNADAAIEYARNGRGKEFPILITNRQGQILHANESWCKLFGFSEEEVQGKYTGFLHGPKTDIKVLKEFNSKLEPGIPATARLVSYKKRGSAIECDVTILPLYDWMYGGSTHIIDEYYKTQVAEALQKNPNNNINNNTSSNSSSSSSSSSNNIDNNNNNSGGSRSVSERDLPTLVASSESTTIIAGSDSHSPNNATISAPAVDSQTDRQRPAKDRGHITFVSASHYVARFDLVLVPPEFARAHVSPKQPMYSTSFKTYDEAITAFSTAPVPQDLHDESSPLYIPPLTEAQMEKRKTKWGI